MQQWIFVAVVALAFVPAIHAQGPLDETSYNRVVLSVGELAPTIVEDTFNVIPYMGNVTIKVNVTIGCFALSQHASDPTVKVAVENLPGWLIAPVVTFDFTPTQAYQPCAETGTAGHASLNKDFLLTLKADAPGIVKQFLNLTATTTANAGGRIHADKKPLLNPIQVQFHPEFTITPSVAFPLTVVGPETSFTVTVVNRGNARNMVMIEGMHVTAGSLAGLGPEFYEPATQGGVDTKVFQVTFKAPDTWSESTVAFEAVSHFALSAEYGAGDFRAQQDVKWVFTNGGPATTPDDNKPAPLPMLPFYALAILGAALMASRRRA